MMVAWTITTTRTFSDMDGSGTDIASGDTVTVNSPGILTGDIPIPGAGSLGAGGTGLGISNGAKFILSAGVNLKMLDNCSINVLEGSVFQSVGTSGSRCTIEWTGTSSGSRFSGSTGGSVTLLYTDITNCYQGFYTNSGYSPNLSLDHCTVTSLNNCFSANRGVPILLRSCTLTTTSAVTYVFSASNNVLLEAYDCAFVSVSDAYLFLGSTISCILANCTYQGLDIDSSDFSLTTLDYDLRIYERATVSTAPVTADAGITIYHPSQLSNGMVYDSTNHIYLAPYITTPKTDALGQATIYTLKKSAYWQSGMLVGSRTWKYWSDSGQPEVGDNSRFIIGGYTPILSATGDTPWSGVNATVIFAGGPSGTNLVITNCNITNAVITNGGALEIVDSAITNSSVG